MAEHHDPRAWPRPRLSDRGLAPPQLREAPKVRLAVDGFGPFPFHDMTICPGGGHADFKRLATNNDGNWISGEAWMRLLHERFGNLATFVLERGPGHVCSVRTPVGDFVSNGVRLEALDIGSYWFSLAARGQWERL